MFESVKYFLFNLCFILFINKFLKKEKKTFPSTTLKNNEE